MKEKEENFRHVMRWGILGRQGKRCQILRQVGNFAHIRFEDGFEAVVSRIALRRDKTSQGPNPPEEAMRGK
jgi:hypothetical protein